MFQTCTVGGGGSGGGGGGAKERGVLAGGLISSILSISGHFGVTNVVPSARGL